MGQLILKEKIVMMSIGESFVVDQLGVFTPKAENLDHLNQVKLVLLLQE